MSDPTAQYPPEEFAKKAHSERLEEGIRIALKAEEDGRGSPLGDWLALHPGLAGELAEFLEANRGLRSAFGPARVIERDRAGETWNPDASIAGFRLRGEIGRGGMGVVYRAYDPRLKREVAIKQVRGGPFLSAVDRDRFRFEAEAVASLDHPAIVPIHASGEADGAPYLVMPLMEGGSLAGKLGDLGPGRSMPPRQAARLVRDVALGVHHAHQRGLLHRDLKPANILLDREGRPHVADFGLARSMNVGPGASTSGAVVGTAAYMAPEQARGEKGLTTAVDVHALGSILYELLVGKPPFGGGDWMAVLRRVQDEPAPSLRRLRSDVPRDLETICLRCLAKRPEDRYPSAQALAQDLSRFLDGEPLGATRNRGWLADASRAVGRRRETLSMTSWAGFLWAGGVAGLAQAVIQVLVLAGNAGWWAYAVFALGLCVWALLYWWFLIRRMAELSPVERLSSALKLGAMLSILALTPAHLIINGRDITPLYQPMLVNLGLAVFAHGATHWGRLYLAGLLILAVSAAMPLTPMICWPAIYGTACMLSFCWVGLHFRTFDREARSGPPNCSGDPVTPGPARPT